MDPEVLRLLIPVLALGTGFVVVVAAVLKATRKPVLPGPNPDLEARMQALEQDLAGVRQELAETNERLDFTERMLARADQPRPLGRGE